MGGPILVTAAGPASAADTSALEVWVGFRPTTSMELGVERFSAWYRRHYGV